MFKFIISGLSLVYFISCDAHMQKGLELYQKRYKDEKVNNTTSDDFFKDEDDIDRAFLEAKETKTERVTQEGSETQSRDTKENRNILTTLYSVSIGETSKGTIVDFRGNGELSDVRIFKNDEKRRITLVLNGVASTFAKRVLSGNGEPLKSVLVKSKNGSMNVSINVATLEALECKIERKSYGFQIVFENR